LDADPVGTLWRREKSNPGRPSRSPSLYRLRYPDSYDRFIDDGKFGRTWKELAWPNRAVHPGIYMEESRKSLKALGFSKGALLKYESRASLLRQGVLQRMPKMQTNICL
jgi:hypothetical protein